MEEENEELNNLLNFQIPLQVKIQNEVILNIYS